jgi:hypothetical protein
VVGSRWWGLGGGVWVVGGWVGVGGWVRGEVRLPPVQHVCYLELAAARDVEPVEGTATLEHVGREDLLHAHLVRVRG